MPESINDHQLIRLTQNLYRGLMKEATEFQEELLSSPLVAIRRSVRSGHVYINVTERNEKGEKVNRYLGREDSEAVASYMKEHEKVFSNRRFLRFNLKQIKNMRELVKARYLQ